MRAAQAQISRSKTTGENGSCYARPRSEDRHFQHQQHQQAFAQSLTAWLAKAQPDVVCLQELKAEPQAFPATALRDLGYHGVWIGERSWNGVAILARECEPVLTRSSLPGNPDDRQARYIEAAVNGVLITSIYLPNGNPQPGPKFDYKLAWFERLIVHGAELMKSGVPGAVADGMRRERGG